MPHSFLRLSMTVTALGAVTVVSAQNLSDAVRYSEKDICGTARYRAMGGAFGALGGDPSCLADNPAGIGVYRGTNFFSITPHLATSATSVHQTGDDSQSRTRAAVSNFAAVFSFSDLSSDHLVNCNFAVGHNRRAETYTTAAYSMDTPRGSFGDYLTNQANNYLAGSYTASSAFDWSNDATTAPFLSMMAYDIYAIGDDASNTHCVINPMGDAQAYQRLTSRTSTRIDDYSVAMAFNFDDSWYLGLSLQASDLSSTVSTLFDEDYSYDYSGSYIAYDNIKETKGTGIGAKIGLIHSFAEYFRWGVALHTPTVYTMTEYYEGAMITDDSRVNDWSSYSDSWKYSYQTPWEMQLSLACILGVRGLISVEYDMRDFSTISHDEHHDYPLYDGYFSSLNNAVANYLKTQHTWKIGGEYRATERVSLRAGYAFMTSPYVDEAAEGLVSVADQNICYYDATKPNYQTLGSQYYLSAGAGWRGNHWQLDASYVFHHTKGHIAAYPADFSNADVMELCTAQHAIDLTATYRF